MDWPWDRSFFLRSKGRDGVASKVKDIFITSTVDSEWNLVFNPRLCSALEERGITCHLPQRDTNQAGTPAEIFAQNVAAIKSSRKILFVTCNESINVGGEVGLSFGLGKAIVALAENGHAIPLMLRFMITKSFIVRSIDELESYADDLVISIRERKSTTDPQ